MITLGGLPFEISGTHLLNAAETEWLRRLDGKPNPQLAPFVLEICEPSAPGRAAMAAHPGDKPAIIEGGTDRVVITDRIFVADLELARSGGTLQRETSSRAALEITLKVAMCSRLPLVGGLPLHSAAIVIGGKAVVFFGPSGAGKSTISGRSPFPVLSDELVAITAEMGFSARATGFWGTFERPEFDPAPYPIAALIELHQEQAFRLARIDRQTTLRKLLGVVIVPPASQLWNGAIAAMNRLTSSVPSYEMGWSLSDIPFDAIRTELSL